MGGLGEEGGGRGGSGELSRWRTIWIEMRVTADRNWDGAAYSLEHPPPLRIETFPYLPRDKKSYSFCTYKAIAYKTLFFDFATIRNWRVPSPEEMTIFTFYGVWTSAAAVAAIQILFHDIYNTLSRSIQLREYPIPTTILLLLLLSQAKRHKSSFPWLL